MTVTRFPTPYEHGNAKSMRRRFVLAVVTERYDAAEKMEACGLDFFNAARNAGVGNDYLLDLLRGLRDEIGSLVQQMDTDLEEEDLESIGPYDYSEIDKLIREIETP